MGPQSEGHGIVAVKEMRSAQIKGEGFKADTKQSQQAEQTRKVSYRLIRRVKRTDNKLTTNLLMLKPNSRPSPPRVPASRAVSLPRYRMSPYNAKVFSVERSPNPPSVSAKSIEACTTEAMKLELTRRPRHLRRPRRMSPLPELKLKDSQLEASFARLIEMLL
jgi:hypothetical protein